MVLNTVVQSISSRFSKHETLAADFSCLHPKNFLKLQKTLPLTTLERISGLLIKFDPDFDSSKLRDELLDFATKWPSLKISLTPGNQAVSGITSSNIVNEEVENIKTFENAPEIRVCNTACRNCPICCYAVLQRFNLYSEAYKSLFLAYKLILTLSSTEVECERAFSKLKIVKSTIRSTISQELLESLMLMTIEKDVLRTISNEEIVNKLGTKSKLMKKLLFT